MKKNTSPTKKTGTKISSPDTLAQMADAADSSAPEMASESATESDASMATDTASESKATTASDTVANPDVATEPETAPIAGSSIRTRFRHLSEKRGRPSKAELAAMGRLPESTAAVATGKAGGTRTAKSKKAGRPKGSKSAIAPVAKRGRKSKAEIEALAAAEKAEIAKLADTLTYKVPSAWDAKDFNRKVVFSFAEQYKTFLDKAKTEREFVREAVLLCEGKGFRTSTPCPRIIRWFPVTRCIAW
jgi:hypothetical protein